MAAPLAPDRLREALKAEGCAVREYQDWRTHNRNAKGDWGPLHGVMMHHTVTGPGTDVIKLCYDGHAALPGPLCHGVITKSGAVWLVSSGRANHAGLGDAGVLDAVTAETYGDYPPAKKAATVDGNRAFYGFEAENLGDGRDPWPLAQYRAMTRAAAAICRAYGWSAKSTIGHREWQIGKVDPKGFDMANFRRNVAEYLALPAGVLARRQDAPPTSQPSLEQRVSAVEKRLAALEKRL